MKEQMNQGVSRSECEMAIKGEMELRSFNSRKSQRDTPGFLERLARAHLEKLDECENLRRLLALRTGCAKCKGVGYVERHMPGFNHYETDAGEECPPYHYKRLPCEVCGAAISENAANALGYRTCASCGKTNSNWRYNRCPDCGELASSEVDREQDSSVSGAGQ